MGIRDSFVALDVGITAMKDVILDPSLSPILEALAHDCPPPVSYTHLRAHETVLDLVCRLLLEKKKERTRYSMPTSA